MKKIILSAFTAGVILVSCAPKASPAKTNEIMPAVASTSSEAISAGHAIFTTNCTKCHGVKTDYVSNRTYLESRPVIAAMSEKAKLSAEQVAQLAAYVNSVAKK